MCEGSICWQPFHVCLIFFVIAIFLARPLPFYTAHARLSRNCTPHATWLYLRNTNCIFNLDHLNSLVCRLYAPWKSLVRLIIVQHKFRHHLWIAPPLSWMALQLLTSSSYSNQVSGIRSLISTNSNFIISVPTRLALATNLHPG